MYHDALAKLSTEELIALVLAQAAQIEAQSAQIEELTRRIAELEAKLGGPPKTPDNSSVPPSQGRKPNRAARRAAKKRKGRPGVFRALAPHPDRIVAAAREVVADPSPPRASALWDGQAGQGLAATVLAAGPRRIGSGPTSAAIRAGPARTASLRDTADGLP